MLKAGGGFFIGYRMKIDKNNVENLTDIAKEDLLKKIIQKLDDLDSEDFFGTQGWRYLILEEDK